MNCNCKIVFIFLFFSLNKCCNGINKYCKKNLNNYIIQRKPMYCPNVEVARQPRSFYEQFNDLKIE